MSRICVKNLGKNNTEKQLRELFSVKGEVTDVKIITKNDSTAANKKGSKQSRGFAFVGFRTEQQAQEAIRYFHNTFIGLSRISVEPAKKLGDHSAANPIAQKVKLKKGKAVGAESIETTGTGAKSSNSEKNLTSGSGDADSKKNKKEQEPEVMNKKKAEFFEMMKPRSKAKHWDNDDQAIAPVADVAVDDTNDNNSTSSEESRDKFEKPAASQQPMSDLEYLRSKMASGIDDNFSDSEDDHSIDNDADQNYHSRSSGNDSESSDNDSMGDNNKDENPYGQNDATETNDYEADDDFEDNSRLFVKNLPYTCIEEEVRELFEGFGVINEVHLPIDKEKKTKGYGFVTFLIPEQAIKSMNELNGSSWQGRVLRITMAEKKKSVVSDGNTNDTKNFLSTYQQKREDERKKNLHSKEGWNASFVRSDTVVDTLAERYGITKASILDTSNSGLSGGDLAVRLAIGETQIIQENRDFFSSHGVDIDALESNHSDSKAVKRSDHTIIVKNLPHDLINEELESMFSRFGAINSFLVPKSKTIALVDFLEPTEARAAYKGLAYRRYKHVPLYLEWAPLGTINKASVTKMTSEGKSKPNENEKESEKNVRGLTEAADADAEDSCGTLYVKNLNFITTEESLRAHLESLGAKGIRTVLIQKKTKGSIVLSQGYGFVEFESESAAKIAEKLCNGSLLDSHALQVKPSEKRLTVSQVKLSATDNKKQAILKQLEKSSQLLSVPTKQSTASTISGKSNKIIARNVAFQANKAELSKLFNTFGTVRKIRMPKKMSGEHRGFAFIEFATIQEAATAMASLKDTHLYGRHLVLEWSNSEEEAVDSVNDVGKISNLRKRALSDQKFIVNSKRAKAIEEPSENFDDMDEV